MHELVPENFMNGLTGAQDKVVMDVHLNKNETNPTKKK